jgi:2-aminoadipate transaminase
MLAPGLRLGWLVAPPALANRIITLRESLDLESSALTQRAVYEYLDRDLLPAHLRRLNAANAERCDAMLHALAEHFTGLATWTRPSGGLFVWLTLNTPHLDAFDRLPDAIERHGVAYVPGGAFCVTGGQRHTVRLNFSNAEPDAIREGIARLRRVFA